MNFQDLMGLSGGGTGQGGPFVVLATANAALTIPDGIRFAFVSVRSNASVLIVTLPAIDATLGCAVVLSCPDGAGNTVTVATPGADTILTAGTLAVSADNLVVLFGAPGTTDWQGHVGT